MGDLLNITPPKELTEDERDTVFQHLFRRLAHHRNTFEIYALAECGYAEDSGQGTQKDVVKELDHWSQELLKNAWTACQAPGGGNCPTLDPLTDTSVATLPSLPSQDHLTKTLNSILFLNITDFKSYSSHTRAFIATFAPIDERSIVNTLKDPDGALKEAQKMTENAKHEEANRSKTLRMVGMGLAGVAGGALIGLTGGLAAPVVGGAVGGIFSFLGVGGTAAGMLATGIASSSVVCGTLFGVYGARSSAQLVERHMREVRDLALVPVHPPKETLAVRLCVSGWLSDKNDVVAPWTIYDTEMDTYALQWEVQALEDLANALSIIAKKKAIGYLKGEIIKRTILAGVFAPMWWMQFGQIIDNPWSNARTFALKAGVVLGTLLAQRVFGTRPVTLTGYSLGSLVIFEALKHLAALPPSQSAHLVQDVFLYGLPAPAEARSWTAIRRVVAGRLVNGYCEQDYILAVLSRTSDASWNIAGLGPVSVKGVENQACEGVEGHLKWRGHIGSCLHTCNAPGVVKSEVEKQEAVVAKRIDEEMEKGEQETDRIMQQGHEAKG